jgi:8-oxo-dGTP pyrophosphatase MutT (NUDIX family)
MVSFDLMIAAYEPADEPEARHRDALLELLRTSPAPFSRHEFAPGHVTASCFIVDPSRGNLLLHHHRRLDRWLQMGGHVEPGETPLQAALREGTEESGLADLHLLRDDIFDIDIHSIPAGRGEPEHLHYDVRYVASTAQPDRIAFDTLRWVALNRVAALMDEQSSNRVIRKIRSLL